MRGMSGGTAYVLDLDPKRVNVQSLDSNELTLSGLDEEDQVLVGVTVANPSGLIGLRGRNLVAVQLILALMVKL